MLAELKNTVITTASRIWPPMLSRGLRSRETLMLALAAVVGLATGLLAVLLIQALHLVQSLAFGTAPAPWLVVLAPTLGALAVGIMVWKWIPEAAGAGISHVMLTIALHSGRIRKRVIPGKLLASAVGLGSGGSGGREGPIVQIGAAVGSVLGRTFHLSEEQIRSLIAAGAAGGIAASFNAPIGGMLFALEVIIGGFAIRHLQTVIVSSVVASVTARQLLGEGLIYSPPAYGLASPWELALYALLGLAAVVVALAFFRGETATEAWAARLRVWPPLRTALGGLAVGLIALAVPEALGTGDHLPPLPGVVREPIAAMLGGELGVTMLAALLLAKLAATVLSLGTGNAVGSFSPLVFMGAALGGLFGGATAAILPEAAVEPGAFALVGTAAVVAAAARAPLTGVLLVFELTGSYDMVVPLMLATIIATFVADRVQGPSIYTAPLLRRGIVYQVGDDVDIMQTVKVGEIMTRDPHVVPADMAVPELREWFRTTRHHGAPVVDGDERLCGIVTLSDIAKLRDSGQTGDIMTMSAEAQRLTAGDICTRQPVTVTPNAPMYQALRRMAAIDVGRLPVVTERDRSRLVGLVRRADVVAAYQRAVTRGIGVQQQRETSRLRDLGGAHFVEIIVGRDAPAAGSAVRDIDWPQRTILISVRRRGELIMPRGSTVLAPGDEITVLTGGDALVDVRKLLTAG